MAHDTEQSDGVIVAMKAANKGARAPAESLERRTPTERNPQRTGTVRTQGRGAVTPGAERIRQFAEQPGQLVEGMGVSPRGEGVATPHLTASYAPGTVRCQVKR